MTINLAGSIFSSLGYYGIFQFGTTDPLTVNILSTGSISGGAIVSAGSQLALTNYGYLYGQDAGITSSSFADVLANRGEIFTTAGFAVALGGGADVLTNSGHITGDINLDSGDDRFYGGGGSVLGFLDLSSGNDVVDLRGAQIDGTDYGGDGNDTFIVDGTSFDLSEGVGLGVDLVKSTVSFELGDNFDNLTLLGAGDINGTGNALANTILGNGGDNRLNGDSGSDKPFGGAGDDRVFGDSGNDTLSSGSGNDLLSGGIGNDVMVGATGADSLFGGAGRDVLTGDVGTTGSYEDVFVFQKISDSANNALSDRISDFRIGEDKIDLSVIDARSTTPANDAFTFVAGAFTNVAGQLRLQTSGADTFVLGDVNGDGVADFRIVLTGNLALTASDFIL
ncbi:calcium-binding protein [Cypionkella sinensis]|uniref:Calcium-binding protein n=1 Tax=Cypionkella sinensis TaxID=1756043 RepID=A0ABV7J066_9RHOB